MMIIGRIEDHHRRIPSTDHHRRDLCRVKSMVRRHLRRIKSMVRRQFRSVIDRGNLNDYHSHIMAAI